MLSLTDKVDYVIDGEMLDWYLDHGLRLEDIKIKTVRGEEQEKLKGITNATIKKQINLEDHTNAIYEGKTKYVTDYTIDSNKHHLETKEQYKIAIDPFDNKGIRDSNGEFRFYN